MNGRCGGVCGGVQGRGEVCVDTFGGGGVAFEGICGAVDGVLPKPVAMLLKEVVVLIEYIYPKVDGVIGEKLSCEKVLFDF